MSSLTSSPRNSTKREAAKRLAKVVLQAHMPVGTYSRHCFSALYHLHVATRESTLWAKRFFWFEPLFRSQCHSVGQRFRMEQLPYLIGRGQIVIGDDVRFSGKPNIVFSSRHSARPYLTIGNGTFLGHNCALTIASHLQIGQHCLIASGVRIADFDGHPTDALQRRRGDFVAPDRVLPVSIGHDVWIGNGASILKGVTLGDRSIVGTRAVVTHSVPADCVAVGNPARIVKRLNLPASSNELSETQ